MIQKEPHKYRNLSTEEYEELFSNYFLDSWSFSKVDSFARNEKAFEMTYIYREPTKQSSSSVAGTAYHLALKHYFLELKDGVEMDVADLQIIAFEEIEKVKPAKWKTQKTTPTIEDCRKKASEIVVALLNNFLSDVAVYKSEIKEIIAVEVYCDQFLTINGVDIPLPCHSMIDLVVKTNEDKVVIIDHKSKASFSDEKELKFSIGKQAITYAKMLEVNNDLEVDEVWFVENKYSQNRDKSPQLNCFKMILDKDTRRLYEALLYEPLKRMLEAISNPDHVYIINESDNFVDKAELYEFWAKTLICEIAEYDIPESKKELIAKRIKKIRDASLGTINPKTIKEFRRNASAFIQYDLTNKDMTKEEKIEHTLNTLGIKVNIAHTFSGYSSDTFLLNVSSGTNIASVQKYKLDIASALNVASIRIMKSLHVYDGKAYLAIESSKTREKDLVFDPALVDGAKIPLGVDNFGKTIFWNTENPSTPHVLICGSTGSGKSVCIVSIMEYAKLAGFTSIVIFDPKFEFKKYNGNGVAVFNDIEEIEKTMEQMVVIMNDMVKAGKKEKTLIVFDEFADAVSSARSGNALKVYSEVPDGTFANGNIKYKRVLSEIKKSLEENMKIILQKGRSSGFRIIAGTQRASVKVITGDAKVNFPVQICFKVPKETDSKVVLDEVGAESLCGNGDGLLNSPDYAGLVRFQSFFKK